MYIQLYIYHNPINIQYKKIYTIEVPRIQFEYYILCLIFIAFISCPLENM